MYLDKNNSQCNTPSFNYTLFKMTDYLEDQENEMEALEAIYPNELEVLSTEPFHSFELTLTSQCDHEESENVSCVLKFTYTGKYPDEAPVMELTSNDEKLEDCYLDQITQLMTEQAEENLGMVMVFTIVTAVQEKIDTLVEEIALNKVEKREKARFDEEEKERKKFEGTRVSIETFLAWREKFNAEIMDKKRLAGTATKESKKDVRKSTGKELFLQDSTFDDSDVRFLEEEGDKVEVDESLFDDLDDLDIDDDLNDLES